MISLMRPNGDLRPSRKAATATSLAALNTAGADPARPPGRDARGQGPEDVRPHRLEGERPGRHGVEAAHARVGQPRRDG